MFKISSIVTTFSLFACLSVMPAAADDIATSVSVQANAPAAITRCTVASFYSSFTSAFNVYNRAAHALIDLSMEYRFYDRDNSQIGQISYSYTPPETLSPQDTRTFNNNYVTPSLAEPPSAVSRVSCRITVAHFTGRLTWKPGFAWQGGSLSPLPKNRASDESAGDSNDRVLTAPSSGNSRSANLKFDVQKAWNDPVQTGGLFVHDSLVIHGGDSSATVRPSDFVLTMSLANGGMKTYPALSQGAPTFQKYNALSRTYATAYEIDPQTDLGRLGSLIVPAHSDVTVTVTFAVPDQVADPASNMRVSFH